jgi:hypothetical protein
MIEKNILDAIDYGLYYISRTDRFVCGEFSHKVWELAYGKVMDLGLESRIIDDRNSY